MALDVPDAHASVVVAEDSVRRFTDAGGTGVVLRFAGLYGSGSEQTELLARIARWHIGSLLGRPGDDVSSLHLADAGTAVVAAPSAPAGTYNVVEDYPVKNVSWLRSWSRSSMRARGCTSQAGSHPCSPRSATAALARSHQVSNRKLRDTAGWAPEYPSVYEGWAEPGMPGRAGSHEPAAVAGVGAGTEPRR